MMTCRELHEFLMAYLEAELDTVIRETFEQHIADCACCKNYLDTYQQTVALSSEAFGPCEDDSHPDLPEELVAAVLAARRARGKG